ncbi:MAG: heat-inducible transcriptional repressor HrcA [Gammaproteobacteria bacterium]|nr:heat-inducible transcriptional repressor HrcA [Gammaproteobacteria bacterium]
MSTLPVLNDRARHLLKTLIDCYVTDGVPVGSKKLADASRLNVSTATIRNVMASLDHMGLVAAPHTSAGRIPTEQGFRLFVDSMLEVTPLARTLQNQLQGRLNPDQDRDSLIGTASALLSEMSHMAGIITIPKSGHSSLRQIEFLSLSDKRILAILVINEKEVQNRVIHVDRDYSQDELGRIANYLNTQFSGTDLFKLRSLLINELHQARSDVDDLMKSAVELADRALQPDASNDDYMLQGQTNLVRYNELDHGVKLQQLFDTFESKRDMLSLLDRCIRAEDIQVFIGREAGLQGLGDCSVITSPYSVDGEILGVLGVIGPTRMAYNKVIPMVDITARLLGLALKAK